MNDPSRPRADDQRRDNAARVVRRWQSKVEARAKRGGSVYFGPVWLPSSAAEEVVEITTVSMIEELMTGQLDGLSPREIESRAAGRAECRAIDALRRRGRNPDVESLDAMLADSLDEDLSACRSLMPLALVSEGFANRVAEHDDVRDVMLTLGPADRRLLSLRACGFDYHELGAVFKATPGTVRKRRERASARARACRAAREGLAR
jgi:DNA-directed RNA polymerase specialized sigma24 family protein